MKKLLTGLAMLVFLAVSVMAVPQTEVFGNVYADQGQTPLNDVPVDVACYEYVGDVYVLSAEDSDVTHFDAEYGDGYYEVVFERPTCPVGYFVESCAYEECSGKVEVEAEIGQRVNLVNIDLYGVPEFTTIGAAIALIGAGYVAYRKRK